MALDLRGYNKSDKPPCVRDYGVERVSADVAAVIRELRGPDGRAHVVGHDWGGVVAWHLAMHHPGVVEKLVILNAPHPAAYLRELRRSMQLLRSWYVGAFQLPRVPEAVIRFRRFAMLRNVFRQASVRPGAFTPDDIDRYVDAFSQPGALTAAINYYRAAARAGPWQLARATRPIDAPTLLVWGERDRYLVPGLTRGLEQWAARLQVERLPNGGHWVQHDEPDAVNRLMLEFFG